MKQIFVTDLDGTLLESDRSVSSSTLLGLSALKTRGCLVVAATGRSLFSLRKVIRPEYPFDYIIFSSGAGIVDWKTGALIQSVDLSGDSLGELVKWLEGQPLGFMFHAPVPENHFFWYRACDKKNSDFFKRIDVYRDYAEVWPPEKPVSKASEALLIFPSHAISHFEAASAELKNFSVVRATSPFDHQSIWLEVFNDGVSKGNAVRWLQGYLGLEESPLVAVGNDYNDLSLLEIADYPFVVANAPKDLSLRYRSVSSNDKQGVLEVIEALKSDFRTLKS